MAQGGLKAVMPLAYKVVGDNYRSAYCQPHEPLDFGRIGTIIDVSTFAYLSAQAAVRRARLEGSDVGPARVIALQVEDTEAHERQGCIRPTGARVVGEVAVLDMDHWPQIPGQTIDLSPAADMIAARVFSFLLGEHDPTHWANTARNAGELLKYRPSADPDVLAAFSLLHDSDPQGHDDHDGRRVGEFARETRSRRKDRPHQFATQPAREMPRRLLGARHHQPNRRRRLGQLPLGCPPMGRRTHHDGARSRHEPSQQPTSPIRLGAVFVRVDEPCWVYRLHDGNKSFNAGVGA